MLKYQFQPQYARYDEWLHLAKEEGFTFEVAELALPLRDEKKKEQMKEWYKNCGLVTNIHGVFIDINPTSNEDEIAKVSARLCEESAVLAKELGADGVVFHSAAFPFLRGAYLDDWAEKTAEYFLYLADKYQLRIYVENCADLGPEPLRRLMKRCNDNRVRVCLDVGHVNYSREPLQSWFLELSDYIGYIHFSDNFGTYDDHVPIGIGSVPWDLVEYLLEQLKEDVFVTFETGTIEQTKKSLRWLRDRGLFFKGEAKETWSSGAELASFDLPPGEREKIKERRRNARAEQLQEASEYVNKTIRRYLSDEIVTRILNEGSIEEDGKRLCISMLVSDLHAFTAAAETLSADQLIAVLNHYYGEMTEIVHRYGGTIIDMAGDGLLVAFGLFNRDINHADHAIAAGIEMAARMDDVNRWYGEQGLPQLHLGIGIHSGDVVAGTIGSKRHAKYGIVGSNVNLTSRIESYSNNEEVLISEDTLAMASAEIRVAGRHTVFPKGTRRQVEICTVTGIGEPFRLSVKQYSHRRVELASRMPVEFYMINEKHTDLNSLRGELISVGEREAFVSTDVPLARYDSLRLVLPGLSEAVFCRVGETEKEGAELVFTSRPKGFDEWLAKLQ